MQDLLKMLQDKAGLSPEQAEKASGVVAEFLSTRVSGDMLRNLSESVPGLAQFSDKIPDNIGEQLGSQLKGFMNRE